MELTPPSCKGFTMYSKSGCPNCRNVKNLLKKENIEFTVIDCDEYLLFEIDTFLSFMNEIIGNEEKRFFPLVFVDGLFLGGYIETQKYLQQ